MSVTELSSYLAEVILTCVSFASSKPPEVCINWKLEDSLSLACINPALGLYKVFRNLYKFDNHFANINKFCYIVFNSN